MFQTNTIQITPEILALVARIDEFKGAWRALGTLAPERLSALRRVATIESIGSSTRIEGSKLTDREVEQLLANLEIKRFDTRDEQEVAGYAQTVARKMAAKPISSLIETKRLMKQGQLKQVMSVMAEEGVSFGRMLGEPAAKEAFGAFMERRKPDFSKV